MPIVFSEEVHSTILTVIPLLAIIVGTSVIVLSLSRRTASLSTYRYFILNFSAWDTALAILCGLAQMKPFPCKGLFMGYVTGILSGIPNSGGIILGMVISLEVLSFFVMPINYVYRLHALMGTVDKIVQPLVLVPVGVLAMSNIIFYNAICQYATLSDEEMRRRFALYNPGLNISAERVSLQSSLTNFKGQPFGFILESESLAWPLLVNFSRANWAINFGVVGFCVYKIHRALSRVKPSMSTHTYNLHLQIYHALIAQALLPIVLAVTPISIFWNTISGRIQNMAYAEVSSIFIYTYPLTNTLTTVIFIKPYRSFFLDVFRVITCRLSGSALAIGASAPVTSFLGHSSSSEVRNSENV